MTAPTAPTAITVLPTPPTTSDPSTFDARADATLVAQQAMIPEINAANAVAYDNAVIAYSAIAATAASQAAAATSATGASGSANTATTQASNASTSATSASGSASTATIQAGNASTSATAASTSATNAAASAASVVRDGSGGVAGLTGFAINLWNAAKTFKSALTFSGTANRVHTLQDRNGIIADDTDLALKVTATVLAASGGAATVGFMPAGTGAAAITAEKKLRETVSVMDFAPVADGVGDDSPAFSRAAKAAITSTLTTNTTVTTSPVCRVIVPTGTYNLASVVDCGTRAVEWLLDDGAIITNTTNLGPNRVVRGNGMRVGRQRHYGAFDTATSMSITANYPPDEPPGVLGIASNSAISTYASRDSVGLYVANTLPGASFSLVASNYTATTVTCPTAVDPLRMRVGMIIDTAHSPKWSGFVTGWASDGSSITVSAWYQFGGTVGTPANGVNAFVSPTTKIWAHNAGVTLNSSSYGDAAAGFEMDVYNNKGDSGTYLAAATGQTWGFDAYASGTYMSSAGYVARGKWRAGYVAESSVTGAVGVIVKGTETVGFAYQSSIVGGSAFTASYNGATSFNVTNTGDMEIGRTDVASSTNIDFHTSGTASDYDARIIASGGSATAGQGVLNYMALQHNMYGVVYAESPTAITTTSINKTGYVSGTSYFKALSLNGVTIGSISGNGSTTSYTTSSDYRLKENITPIAGAWERLKAYKPCEFEFKSVPGERVRGFIAHEFAEVCPQAVVGEKDAVDERGTPIYQGIDAAKTIADLMAALQEAMRRIEALENK